MAKNACRRVLMTGDTVGGVWTFTMELAEALQAAGVEVWLATLGGIPSVDQRREAARLCGERYLWRSWRLEWMEDAWKDVERSREWLIGVAAECRPDVIHLNTLGHGGLPWTAPTVLTVHSCVVSWWAAVKGCDPPPEWSLYHDEVIRAIDSAVVVAAPSRAMAESVRRHHGREDCLVIPNGRSASRFRCGPKEPVILTAGRLWDAGKNTDTLLRVAPRLPWPVYLAGKRMSSEPPPEPHLNCRFLGQLSAERLALWYGRAPLFVSLARYEPFGLCGLEAALSGCALVLGDIPSQREVWRDAAVFVDPDDDAALEAVLGELIRDESRLSEMSRRAAVRAREFTPERLAGEYLSVYQEATRERYLCAS